LRDILGTDSVTIYTRVLHDVVPYSLVYKDRSFGGIYCFFLHSSTWRRRQHVCPKVGISL